MRVQRPSYRVAATSMLALGLALAANAAHATFYVQDNLVTDGSASSPPGPPAANTDPDLINPWGIASSATGPLWVSDNGSGVATIYNGQGVKQSLFGGTVPQVTIATPPGQTPGTAAPTGQVFNGGGGFNVTSGGLTGSSAFIFATEDGTISGWSPTVSRANSILAVDNSQGGTGAVYKGLTMGTSGGQNLLYAANFRAGTVQVYNSSFGLVNTISDPTAPAGYAPFNVLVANGKLYVSYALQDSAKHDDVAGAGHGFVDTFNLDGTNPQRLIAFTPGGVLNSPWGLDIAPSGFGNFGGDLLVGNFGDGTINVFDPNTGAFLGTIDGANGQALVNGDLWDIVNGNGGAGGNLDSIYITAGVLAESEGLFASISVPEPGSLAVLAGALGIMGLMRRRTA